MSVQVRIDSLYQFASPLFDERQGEYVWGISDPPDPAEREDDQFHELREGDRLDILAQKYLGSSRYFWVIMHYNNIPNAIEIDDFIGKQLRIPSRATLERLYVNVIE